MPYNAGSHRDSTGTLTTNPWVGGPGAAGGAGDAQSFLLLLTQGSDLKKGQLLVSSLSL